MKLKQYLVVTLLLLSTCVWAKTREEIPEKFKWNLKDIYATPEAFQTARKSVQQQLGEVDSCKGHLAESASQLKKCMEMVYGLNHEFVRLAAYTLMSYDENLKNLPAQKDKGEVDQIGVVVREKIAFLSPEIQAMGSQKVEAFLKQEPGLGQYKVYLMDTLRSATHTLSEPEEALLSRAGMISASP